MIYLVSTNDDRNFGGVLQSYALQTHLKKLGYNSSFITTKKNLNYMAQFSKRLTPKELLRNLRLVFTRKKYLDSFKKFDDFVRDYQITTDRVFASCEEIKKNLPQSDAYIVGSDQMWPPENMLPENFLEFAPENAKRISYAVSMGRKDIDGDKIEEFKEHLSNIDFVSVREESSKEVIEKCTDKEVLVHCDPAFFLDENEWRSIEQKPEHFNHDKYILLYMIYVPTWLTKELKKLKKQTGYDVVLVTTNPMKTGYCDEHLRYMGPREFLWLVDNAQMVISSSFHGCVFSSIFKKSYVAIVNPNRPERHRCLLKMLGLEDREVTSLDVKNFTIKDYDSVSERIEKQRNRATEYLKSTLGVIS